VIGIDQPMGNRIWVLVNTYPDFDDNHQLRQVVVTFMDMTERKRAEEIIHADQVELQRLLDETKHSRQALLSVIEDQKEAQEQVRQLNAELDQRVKDRTAQLEAAKQELEAFSYSVSHDLRAPLRALDGYSAILISDYHDQLDQEAQSYLTRIQEASRRMGQLIEDLLNLSRITRREVSLDRVDLSLLARQIIADLLAQSSERQVKYEISPDLVVRADPGLIKIALENLLHNALKYSSKKEVALIQVGVLNQPGPQGRIYFVRDNGAGFDMTYANKLFTPFQRLHGAQEFPGTGIGLTIVQRIISRHGGRIWPEASVNQGATFYFTLGAIDDSV
jgi:light-regulated signal transduction histidine kinase (bacteriophytochrome)